MLTDLTKHELELLKLKHAFLEDTDPWYSKLKVEKLLEIRLKDQQIFRVPAANFENEDELSIIIPEAINKIDGINVKGVAIPLAFPEHTWCSLVIKNTPNGSLHIIYNNSSGKPLVEEKNYSTLLKVIAKTNSDFHLTDLQLTQQLEPNDSGAFTVDNLLALATMDGTYHMSKVNLQHALEVPADVIADGVRAKHISWLKNEGITVQAIKYENKEIAIQEAENLGEVEGNFEFDNNLKLITTDNINPDIGLMGGDTPYL